MTATFSMLDHLNKLELAGRAKDRFICPVCGGNDLTVQLTGNHAGAYQCWSGQCKPENIRQAVSPLEKRQPLTQVQYHRAQLSRSDRKAALKAAEVKAKCDDLVYQVLEGCFGEGEAFIRLRSWCQSEGHNEYDATKVLRGILAQLVADKEADDGFDPTELKKAIEGYVDERDPFRRALLERSINRDFGVRGRALADLGRIVIASDDGGTALMEDLANNVFSQIEERSVNGAPLGLTSGFVDLDEMTQGFQSSDLIVLAGRPAMGKTALAIGCALGVASQGKKVLIFSLEMSKEQLTYRMLSCFSGVDVGRLRSGKLGQIPDHQGHSEWDRLGQAVGNIASMPIEINDLSEQTVTSIEAECLESKPEMIVIDYCTLLEGPGDNEYSKVTYNTKKLKILARKLNIPVILLSQLSRAVEARKDKRPLMSDLRQSGSVEQDADVIMMLYREEYYDPETPGRGLAEVIIAKHRNGPTGTVKLLFEPAVTRFRNLARRSTHGH